MAALVILCAIIAIVIGVWYNINYGKFTPKIEIFSDGTGRMLFLGVSERCKKQMVRFNAEYQDTSSELCHWLHFVEGMRNADGQTGAVILLVKSDWARCPV